MAFKHFFPLFFFILLITLIISILIPSISGTIDYTFNDQAKVNIDENQTIFYVPNAKSSDNWTIGGIEINRLFDGNGTNLIDSNKKSINIKTHFDKKTNVSVSIRNTKYSNNIVIKDIYNFNKNIKDIRSFPISHKVCILNGNGLSYRYTVKGLDNNYYKQQLFDTTESFDKNMKVEWDDGYSWAWVGWPYGGDSLSVQYNVKSNDECFNVRLFDPPKKGKSLFTNFSNFKLTKNNPNVISYFDKKRIYSNETIKELLKNGSIKILKPVTKKVLGVLPNSNKILIGNNDDVWNKIYGVIFNNSENVIRATASFCNGSQINGAWWVNNETLKFGYEHENSFSDLKCQRIVYEISDGMVYKPTGNRQIFSSSRNSYEINNYDIMSSFGNDTNMTFFWNNTNRSLMVSFYGNSSIDPTIIISEKELYIAAITNQTQIVSNTSILELSNDIVGYWSFDTDDNITAHDYSSNNNTGSYVGDVYDTPGRYGLAYDSSTSDLIGDYVQLNSANGLNFDGDDFTFSAWVKAVSYNYDYPSIFSAHDATNTYAYIFGVKKIDANNAVPFMYGGNNGINNYGTINISAGSWHHVLATRSGTNLSFYVDGVYDSSKTEGGSFNYNPAYLPRIGYQARAPTAASRRAWYGQIDELMIFNVSMNSAQALAIYNNQSSRFKDNGTTTFVQQTLNESGNNRINLTATFNNDLGSRVDARLGYWSISNGYDDITASTNLNKGLVAYFHADGNANDSSGNGNNGVFNGASNASVSGIYGNAFGFNGTSGYINVSSTALDNLTENLSIGGWINVHSWDQFLNVLGKDDPGSDGYSFQLRTSSCPVGVYFILENSTTQITGNEATVPCDEWHFIFGTYDGFTQSIYLDGLLVGQSSAIGPLINSNKNFGIGGDYARSRWFNGSIDEVMVYNRTLNSDEVKELYVKGTAKFDYTAYKELTSNVSKEYIIPYTTTNVLPDLRLYAGTDNFYTPIIYGNMTLETFNIPYAPILSSVILNSTNTTFNDTDQNLTGYPINITDANDDDVSLVYNWYKENTLEASSVFINDANLFSYFPFNNDSLDYKGDMIGTDHGTIESVPGKIGNAYNFSGNDYIDYGDVTDFDGLTALSFSVWVKPNIATMSDNAIFAKRWGADGGSSTILAYMVAGGILRFELTTSSGNQVVAVSSTGITNTSKWYHIVGVWPGSSSNGKLYFDSIDDTSSGSSLGGGISNTADRLVVGTYYDNAHVFKGKIDELQFYSRALTSTEVGELYHGSAYGGDVMDSSQTTVYDNWTLGIVPIDSELIGDEVNSSKIYIRNPNATYPKISFISPTPANASTQSETTVKINVSVDEENLTELNYYWNGTNYTMYDTTDLIFMLNLDNRSSLGESNSLVKDISKNELSGTVTSATVNTTDCVYGNCYSFDGVNDYIDFGTDSAIRPTDKMTMSYWIKTNYPGNQGYRVISNYYASGSTRHGYATGIGNNNASYFILFKNDWNNYLQLYGTTKLNDGAWHNVLLSWQGSDYTNAKIYVDGKEDGTTQTVIGSPTSISYTSSSPTTLGARGGAGGAPTIFFNGSIDEFRIWHKTFTAEEVYEEYVSNLNKYNNSQWYLNVNQKENATNGLSFNNYTYKSCATNNFDYINCTEERSISIIEQLAPILTSVILNSTDISLNDTDQNLTGYPINITDVSNKNVSLAYNWYLNDTLEASSVLINNPNLLTYLPFNNDSLDYKGDNDGYIVLTNSPTLGVSGVVGNSVHFNEANSEFYNLTDGSNNVNNLTDNFSISVWINSEDLASNGVFLSDWEYLGPNYGWSFHVLSSNKEIQFCWRQVATSCITSTQPLTENKWYHTVITYEDGSQKLYVNGAINVTRGVAGVINSNNIPIQIGSRGNAPSVAWDGKIDELQIYKGILTADEVSQLYHGSAYGGDVMDSSQTTVYDNWTLGIVPIDSELIGDEVNSSEILIRQILETTCYLNTISPIEYPNNVTANGSSDVGFGDLYLNGSLVVNPFNQLLGAGDYLFEFNYSGDSNYKSCSNSSIVTVNPITSQCNLIVNSSVTYPENVYAEGTSTNGYGNLYKNNSLISNPFNQKLSVGDYLFEFNYSGNQNYSSCSNFSTVTVNIGTPNLLLSIYPNSSIPDGTQSTVTGLNCPSELTCNLYRNSSSVSNPDIQILPVGNYSYEFNTSGNTNYSSYSVFGNLNVTFILPIFNFTIQEIGTDWVRAIWN